ncbi:MAG: galactokinase [Acidimicrobiales bacterium]
MTVAYSPGRVNLIGDHTDYSGGLVCPMAIDLGTTVRVERGSTAVRLTSDAEAEPAAVPLAVDDPAGVAPPWARYVAGVVAELRPREGASGTVTTTLPVGAGLSSSAALQLAVALALGADDTDPVGLAELCQRAEQVASGVPCGIMDQLVCAAGVAGHALLIDCTSHDLVPVPIPPGVEIVVIHSGQSRTLVGSEYAARRSAVEAAAGALGASLREAPDLSALDDPVLRRRARHVVTENQRVRDFVAALADGDAAGAGSLMAASHASLKDDFEVSTPVVDALVARIRATPGVWGARMTGAGFGGCVVALTIPGALAGLPGWVVTASAGARIVSR